MCVCFRNLMRLRVGLLKNQAPLGHESTRMATGLWAGPNSRPSLRTRVRKAEAPGRGWPSPRAQGPPFPVVLTL